MRPPMPRSRSEISRVAGSEATYKGVDEGVVLLRRPADTKAVTDGASVARSSNQPRAKPSRWAGERRSTVTIELNAREMSVLCVSFIPNR